MKSLLIFLMFISLSLSSRPELRRYLSNGFENTYYSLNTSYSYCFELYTSFDDTFKFRLRLSKSYSAYDLSLYYYCHSWSGDSYYTRTYISPKSSIKGTELYLEKKLDINRSYTTLIVEPQKSISYLSVKLSSEDETITTIILLAVFIPLGFCIFVAVISFVCIRRCRYKRLVVSPVIEPIQPTVTVQPAVAIQPVYVQPSPYQPPTTQMQYIPPPNQPQYIPPPY